ncbi:hypothetical protein BCR44DRAFT_1284489 [Catenaria anguillulae PL171]|uniref:Uncharacterized protein n=1 Tax=Catenaria anguillulae PL171 TaxID=765915 RepID=A0A1Y2HYY4_9FUNG|nr:hypothetical protein BCR44DRAFT_1284489 [Catenaria anguillulae PL171]
MHNRIHILTEQLSEQRRIAQSHEIALIHISSWLRQQGVNIPFNPSAAPGSLDALSNQQQQQRQHQQAQVAIQLNGQFIQDESLAARGGYTSPTPTGSSLSPTASMGMDPLSLSRTGSMSPTQLALLAGMSHVSPGLTASMAALDMTASPNMHMLHVSGPGSRRGSMDTSAAGMMGLDPAMLMQMQQMQQQNQQQQQQQQQQQLMMQMQMQAQAQQQHADGTTPLSISSALDPMFMTQLNINGLGHQ